MRLNVRALLAGSALVAIGASGLAIKSSVAGSFGGMPPPAPAAVGIYSADGGPLRVGVDDSVRLDVAATTGPGVFLAVAADSAGTRLGVDVANTPDVNVANIPTVGLQNGTQVTLAEASLNFIGATTNKGVCTYNAGDPDSLTVGTTAENIPSSPLAGRTAITIYNMDTSKHMWCFPLGTASATAAAPIYQHTTAKYEGLNGGHVSCRCESSTCSYGFLEEKCYQQAP